MKMLLFYGGLIIMQGLIADNEHSKEQLDKLYEGRSGYGISSEESQTLVDQGGAPTYGEITYEGAENLLNHLKVQANDIVYDLGCGIGKFIIQAHLTTPVQKAVGVELAPTRLKQAQTVKKQLESQKKIKRYRCIEFREEDIAKTDLSDATIVYMCSTCFSPELLKKIADNAIQSKKRNVRIVSLKRLPDDCAFKEVDQLKIKTTWSNNTTAFIYCRKDPKSLPKHYNRKNFKKTKGH